MIDFKCGERSTFEFEMQIAGDAVGLTPSASFVIITKEIELGFKAVQGSNGFWSVTVPDLAKHLDPGTYPFRVEVILGESYFIPTVGECSLSSTPRPVISGIKQAPQPAIKAATGPTITFTSVKPAK